MRCAVVALGLAWSFAGFADELFAPEDLLSSPSSAKARAFSEAWQVEVEGGDPLKAAEAYARAESLCETPCWLRAASRVRRAACLARSGKLAEAKALLQDAGDCPPEFEGLRREILRDGEPKPPAAGAVSALLAGLGDDAHAVREKATRDLKDLGPGILPELRAALARTEDLEVRTRLSEVVEALEGPELWLGFFRSTGEPRPFVLSLRRGEGGSFAGSVLEPVLQDPALEGENAAFLKALGAEGLPPPPEVMTSTVEGKLEKDGKFRFLKTYVTAPRITLSGEGRLEGDIVSGTWERGDFRMRRDPAPSLEGKPQAP